MRSTMILPVLLLGFIKMLIGELWQLLDGGEGDYRLTAPRTHPLDPMDRTSHKVYTTITCMLIVESDACYCGCLVTIHRQ